MKFVCVAACLSSWFVWASKYQRRQERQSSKNTSSNNRKSGENSDKFLLSSASFWFCLPLSLVTWNIFNFSVYYLSSEVSESNSADRKHTATHHSALPFIYIVQAHAYVFMKFLWKFENLNHREDELQPHTLHFTRHLNFSEKFSL